MQNMIHKGSSSLADRVKEAILHTIETEDFVNNKLPAESKLAAKYGVSVAVVREALLLLREDGIITKKHGSGNYIHKSALDHGVRIDQLNGFKELVEKQGYIAEDRVDSMEKEFPDERVRRHLHLGPEDMVFHIERTITADGEAAIHCSNYLPEKLFRSEPTEETMNASLYQIFDEFFWMELAYGQLSFYPYLTTAADHRKFGFPEKKPIIVMDEKYYSMEDVPMAYSRNMFNDKYITVNMLSR